MNYFMWGASALMGLTTGVHLFLGTGEIMTPILSSETLHPVVQSTTLVVWHMVTLVLAVSTVAMAYLAKQPNKALALFIMTLHFGFAAIFLYVTLTMFGALFTLPQWSAFLLDGLLMLASVILPKKKAQVP